eukprot:8353539-Alexandrium_andersonii.AAC.1
MEAWPAPIFGWEAGVIQGLRADYMMELAGRRSGAGEVHRGPLELGVLSQLAWAALPRPVQVLQSLL